MAKHHDYGSLLTMDVLLSDPSDFSGGAFCTLEPDGHMQTHSFEQGDLLIFQSHKYHWCAHAMPHLKAEWTPL